MEGVAKKSDSPTLERILISYSEYERLKNIEKEFVNLQQQHKHSLENTSDSDQLVHGNDQPNQFGEGIETPEKKSKLTNLEEFIEEPSVLEKIASLVATKIQATSTPTSLFKPKDLSSPLTVGIATPITTPPQKFGFTIKKDDENDDFGNF